MGHRVVRGTLFALLALVLSGASPVRGQLVVVDVFNHSDGTQTVTAQYLSERLERLGWDARRSLDEVSVGNGGYYLQLNRMAAGRREVLTVTFALFKKRSSGLAFSQPSTPTAFFQPTNDREQAARYVAERFHADLEAFWEEYDQWDGSNGNE